ncbi:MAG: ATP-grasp domain-containing protein [Acetobacteraceae bacterium]|nr:ATP-grasp domain-containing protein [Acetobacteraceae bacterium]
MRLLVCEYVTGGGLVGKPLSGGLLLEAELMVQALATDLANLPDVSACIARDTRLPRLPLSLPVVPIADDPWKRWAEALAQVDAFWPIAPETGGVLERLAHMAEKAGVTLIGCPPPAIALATSKRRTIAKLAASGIPTPYTLPLAAFRQLPHSTSGFVIKPDDGCGAEGVRIFENQGELDRYAASAAATQTETNLIIQPRICGEAHSLSLICHNGEAALLSCNRQLLTDTGAQLRYAGFVVGGAEKYRETYSGLAARIAAVMPQLSGYVGVDLIASPSGPVVLEINPRLTTPYAALSQSLGTNAAALILASARGLPLPAARPKRAVRLTLHHKEAREKLH